MVLILALLMTGAAGDGYREPVRPGAAMPDIHVLGSVPFEYHHEADAVELLTLETVGSEPNGVTDYESWFEDRSYPGEIFHAGGVNDAIRGTDPPEDIPPVIDTDHGPRHLYQVMRHRDALLASYGEPPNRFGVVLDPTVLVSCSRGSRRGGIDWVLDLTSLTSPPRGDGGASPFVLAVRWAIQRNGVLYVSTAHRTYADLTEGMNGYITAIDLSDFSVLWRSEPLVCNSENFLVIGDAIICGYGFTAEDDYVYVLNRLDGSVVQSVPVSSAPDYFDEELGIVYVRCYDTDYQMRIVN